MQEEYPFYRFSYGILDKYRSILSGPRVGDDKGQGVRTSRAIIHAALLCGQEWAKLEMFKHGITKIYSIDWEANPEEFKRWNNIFNQKHYSDKRKPAFVGRRADGGAMGHAKS